MVCFTLSLVQLNSQDRLEDNMAAVTRYVQASAERKADLVCLPENAFYMQEPGKAETPDATRVIEQCRALAKKHGIWLLIGSAHIPDGKGKYYNRSLLVDAQGGIVSQYDKIHLFDVTLKNGESYKESERIAAGAQAVMADLPWGRLGMTVCYDLRFPHLYRALAKKGADFLAVPAAFTYTTGMAHWHALLRARAIENGCYVFAPAQCGFHPGKRRTYGHSLVVSPWGEIVAEASEDEAGITLALIDTQKVAEARSMIPALTHDREFGEDHL